MSGVVSLCLLAMLLAQPPIALDVERDRDVLRVNFTLEEDLPEEIGSALPSGAQIRIRYPLRVRNPRRMWWDKKIWKGEAVATAIFDPVTGRYRCELALDGVIVSSAEIESSAAALDFLTSPGPVLLSLPPTKRSELRVRMRAIFSSSTKWLLFPSVNGTRWIEVPLTSPEPAPSEDAVAGEDVN
jgi:hypothetical protein